MIKLIKFQLRPSSHFSAIEISERPQVVLRMPHQAMCQTAPGCMPAQSDGDPVMWFGRGVTQPQFFRFDS
jgi:hypothetical protein